MDSDTEPFWRYLKTLKQDCFGLPPLRLRGSLFTTVKDKARIILKEFRPESGSYCRDLNQWELQDRTAYQSGSLRNLQTIWLHLYLPYLTSPSSRDVCQMTGPWLSYLLCSRRGNVQEASNYRSVSLTWVACKLLEYDICSHVLKYLDQHHLVSSYQHGCRKGHSCESQILITLDDLYR